MMNRKPGELKSLVNVSALSHSLDLSWEDNSGCASQLSSVNLRFWPDGIISDKETQNLAPIKSLEIPRNCLKLSSNIGDGQNNIFSFTLSSNKSCSRPVMKGSVVNVNLQWTPLDNCRKYTLEMEPQYFFKWNGPKITQDIFTSSQQGLKNK